MSYILEKAGRLYLALAMALVLLGVALPAFAQDEGPWLVTEARGDAWMKAPDGAKKPLHQGDEIVPGSVVGVDASGRAILSRAGTAMTLSPNSETEIPADSDQGARTTILQRLGALLLQVDKRPEQHFEVDTPYLAAVVKGTTFTVSVDGAGAAVHVVEGAVEVGAIATGEVAMVRPGQTAQVSSQSGSGLKVSGLGVPAGKLSGGEQQGQKAVGGDSSQAAVHGQGKGLKIEQPVGWAGIDIAMVSDGFVAALPAPGAAGVEKALSAGGRPGSTGNAVFGLSGGNGVASAGVGAASNGAAKAGGAAAASSGGLSGAVQGGAAAAAAAAQSQGQAVNAIVKSANGNGNGKGKGNS